FTLIATVAGLAQTANQNSTLRDLQRQLDEMRSQMGKKQKRNAELEGTKGGTKKKTNTHPVPLQSETAPAKEHPSQTQNAKSREEPTSFHFKGLTLTPGGFLEGTMLVRTRNENADIANTYSAIPLNGSSNAKLSEFRGTARNSEFSLLVRGTAGRTKLKGY